MESLSSFRRAGPDITLVPIGSWIILLWRPRSAKPEAVRIQTDGALEARGRLGIMFLRRREARKRGWAGDP